ncbi:MAG: XdhC family protein, partial [Spirochaetaceae bacterium]
MGVFEEAARLERENRPFALATILRAKGSTPRNEGAMIVRSDGTTSGTVGGGAMELYVAEQALEAMAEGNSRVVSRELYGSGEASTGMECGGTMEVHIHVVKPKPRLLLVGGGHVNLAIARMAAILEFDLAVAEEREDFATFERFPMARSFYVAPDIRKAIGQAEVNEETSVIIATKAEDIEAAEVALRSPAGYVGMLGSKRKVALATKRLREAGIPERRIAEFHAPIGLDIGAETPEEIALSVLSEILAFRDRRSGQSLKKMIQDLVVIRGAGDIATGIAWRLRRSGFPVVCLEREKPTVIRRSVSFASALYEEETVVEGIRGVRAEGLDELY